VCIGIGGEMCVTDFVSEGVQCLHGWATVSRLGEMLRIKKELDGCDEMGTLAFMMVLYVAWSRLLSLIPGIYLWKSPLDYDFYLLHVCCNSLVSRTGR
jgi:hypothetical protein